MLPSPASSPGVGSVPIPTDNNTLESPPIDGTSTPSRKRQRSRSMQSDNSSSSAKRSLPDATQKEISTHTLSLPDEDQDMAIDAYMDGQDAASHSSTSSTDPAEKPLAIQKLQAQPIQQGQTWFLVSKPWWNRWTRACSGQTDKQGPLTEKDIKSVANLDLVDEYNNLRTGLIEKVDYEIVPQQGWDLLTLWYGQPTIVLPRKVIARGQAREMTLELYPPRFKVVLLSTRIIIPPEEVQPEAPTIEISRGETTLALCNAAAQMLKPGYTEQYRVWDTEDQEVVGIEYPSGRLFLHNARIWEAGDVTIEESTLLNNDVIIVEFKQPTGQWIVASPSNDRAPTPQPIFSQESSFFNRLGKSTSSTSSSLAVTFPARTSFGPPALANSYSSSPEISREPGTLGLGNMGNTCFMNSALQALAHCQELADYFLTGVFKDELNPDNPLGMHGAIAESFGALLQRLWAGTSPMSSYSPREFKQALQRFAPQFSGYQQHDSQELVAFLLDGLHEDLNRVLKKPYVEKPEWGGGGDLEMVKLAQESWEGYMKRNDSVIVDLFQGQYRSTLVCPECDKVSITFDPFMYLTLPLPVSKKWHHVIYYIPWDLDKPHIQVPVEISTDASFKDLRHLLGKWLNANPDNLLTVEVWSHKFYKYLDDSCMCNDINDKDIIVCFELPCHAQQSRTYKAVAKPDDPFILPLYLSDAPPSVPSKYTRHTNSTQQFGYPSIVVIDRKQATSRDAIYDAVIDRLRRWSTNPRDLYTWQAKTPSVASTSFSSGLDSASSDGSLQHVPIHINGTADSLTEIKQTDGIVTVHEVPTDDEQDIGDQKSTLVNSIDDYVMTDGITCAGTKQNIFTTRLHSGHKDMGCSAHHSRLETWESRMSDDDPDAVLLQPDDALFCEFDENMKAYYFGDTDIRTSHWDKWETFNHPEYTASKNASLASKGKGISLQDCLDEFTKEEQLGEEDLWYCPQCKKHQQATKKFDLWKAPDVLVVHLKRFSNSRTLRDKIDAFVDFPTEGLDLSSMVGERLVAQRLKDQGVDIEPLELGNLDEPLLYDLFGVDEHMGGLGGGHYRAYAFNHITDKWYHFDDSYVTPAKAADSVTANAYLLFYRKRKDVPLGGKTYEKVEEARQKREEGAQLQADAAPTADGMVVDQLPTPPNEPVSGPSYLDTGKSRLSALKTHTTRNGYTPLEDDSGSSIPPLDDDFTNFDSSNLDSSFDDLEHISSSFDPLETVSHQFDYPAPSSNASSPIADKWENNQTFEPESSPGRDTDNWSTSGREDSSLSRSVSPTTTSDAVNSWLDAEGATQTRTPPEEEEPHKPT